MRAAAARLRPRWNAAVLRAAVLRAAVLAGLSVRNLPEAVGALFVSYGLGLAWRPLGFVALGAFLLLMGRKL